MTASMPGGKCRDSYLPPLDGSYATLPTHCLLVIGDEKPHVVTNAA